MKKILAAVSVWLLWATLAIAESLPDQTILGAEKPVGIGELVILTVSPPKNVPKSLKQINYKWKILELSLTANKTLVTNLKQNVQEQSDGSSVVFGSGVDPTKRFIAILSIGYLFAEEKNGKLEKDDKTEEITQASQLLMATVTLDGEINPCPPRPPGPGPNPSPNPPSPSPGPDFPPGRFGLAEKAFNWSAKVNLPPDQKAQSAQALAASFSTVASQIAAGTLTNPVKILQETKNSNGTALKGVNIPNSAWEAWGNEFQKYTFDLYKTSKLKSPTDFADAWREIAAGLSQVK
jgi:hypothetical protein